MLYTVVPLERIYSYRTESILGKSKRNTESAADQTEYINLELPHGRLYARREEDHYIVDGIRSTDMDDYLNTEYMPGSRLTNLPNSKPNIK